MKFRAHKFNATRCEADGRKFASKKERKHYFYLRELEKQEVVTHFHEQVPIRLTQNGAPLKYVCDFQVFFADGHVEYQDVKGMRTALYIAKKKLVEDQYPFKITEV